VLISAFKFTSGSKMKALYAHSTFHTCLQKKNEKAKLWYGVGSPMGAA
jgi:hypothetical protein